jgi:hypothetical protein
VSANENEIRNDTVDVIALDRNVNGIVEGDDRTDQEVEPVVTMTQRSIIGSLRNLKQKQSNIPKSPKTLSKYKKRSKTLSISALDRNLSLM